MKYIVNVSSGWPLHDPNPCYHVDELFDAEETSELATAVEQGYLRLPAVGLQVDPPIIVDGPRVPLGDEPAAKQKK